MRRADRQADAVVGLVDVPRRIVDKTNGRKPSRKVLRRLERIEALPRHQQATLLKTIDTFLRGAGAA